MYLLSQNSIIQVREEILHCTRLSEICGEAQLKYFTLKANPFLVNLGITRAVQIARPSHKFKACDVCGKLHVSNMVDFMPLQHDFKLVHSHGLMRISFFIHM